MNNHCAHLIYEATGATDIISADRIQSLWSGYGEIVRIRLQGGIYPTVILKHITLPQPAEHPRGWNTDLSHQRKLKSYRVETYWYECLASLCSQYCPVPKCLRVEQNENETLLLLTDLSDAGFTLVQNSIGVDEIYACLSWLAYFHATFMHLSVDQQKSIEGLWECGSYWHLDTRPDELDALNDKPLKEAAPLIDQTLKQCQFQTLIHGDAKLSNFCFMPPNKTVGRIIKGSTVAAVDFQYVGKGCGMKDVVYFLGSCLSEQECEATEIPLLNYYFRLLTEAVSHLQPHINTNQLEQEWRSLYDVAWADFHRFLKGWSPGHWKINSYSERLTQQVIRRLNNNR